MTEHKEPKLCPFIQNGVANVDQDIVSGMWECVEDKCAMWRETNPNTWIEITSPVEVEDRVATIKRIPTLDGHCGIAGKP